MDRPTRHAEAPATPRPAATIVLVRPGADGLEVLLTRRPDSMAFAAGLHVFPGGRVEPSDADSRLVARARGPVDETSFRIAHRIAAIRETWEEVGVLLAAARGRPSSQPPSTASDRRRPFADLVEENGLELLTDELVDVARWTTPRAFPRRFDARFFVARLPAGAVLDLDPGEVVDHAWLTPRAALAAMAGGSIAMWPPTSTTLQRLERAESFEEVRDGLARAEEPPIGIERLAPDLRVMTGQNAFGPAGRPANTVLVGRGEVVVVDPGDPGEAFLDAIEAEVAAGGGRIVAIALTHVDPGHASGSEELRARTDVPILVGAGGAAPLSWPAVEIGSGDVGRRGGRGADRHRHARPPARPPGVPDRRRDALQRRRADRPAGVRPTARGRRRRPAPIARPHCGPRRRRVGSADRPRPWSGRPARPVVRRGLGHRRRSLD